MKRSTKTVSHFFPHFLVVGMMKAGTTTIYEHIAGHPKVRHAIAKELNYFTRDFGTLQPEGSWGLEYRDLLGVSGEDALGILYGEASPSYIAVPDRLFQFNPSCKIIISLRDPVERALSQIRHYERYEYLVKEAGYADLIEKSERLEDVDVVRDSMYSSRLASYLDIFPHESISVVSFESLISDPQAIMNELFSFLGLASNPIDESFVGARTELPPREVPYRAKLEAYFSQHRGQVAELLASSAVRLSPGDLQQFQRY